MIKKSKETKEVPLRIALSTGGTGGHVFPAVCLAKELTKRGYHVSLCIDQRGKKYINPDMGNQEDLLIFYIAQGPGIIGAIKRFITLFISIFTVLKSFINCRPNLVVGFGGYTTVPVMVAAKLLRIPVVLHEQNAVLGRVNRWMAPYVQGVALGFERTKRIPEGLKTAYVGNPVADDIMQLQDKKYPKFEGKLKILVIGGSQGALLFSDIVSDAMALLPKILQSKIELTQQTRQEALESIEFDYRRLGISATIQPFFHNMADLYAQSHLVICRAGAITVAEVHVARRPAIFVPLRIATDNHQYFNAVELTDEKLGWVVEEKEFTSLWLAMKLQNFLQEPILLEQIGQELEKKCLPNATVTLANWLEDLLPKRQ